MDYGQMSGGDSQRVDEVALRRLIAGIRPVVGAGVGGVTGSGIEVKSGGPVLERVSERLQKLLAVMGIVTRNVEAFGDRILGAETAASGEAGGNSPRPEPTTTEQRLSLLLTALEGEAHRLGAAAGRLDRIG